MSRGQKLAAVIPPIKLGALKQSTGPFAVGEWSREVDVGDRRYKVTLRHGDRVRIAYKPAGQNWGYRWIADVWRADTREGEKSHVWDGEVTKSAGVRGILLAAGIVWTEGGWWSAMVRAWFQIGRAAHRRIHPQCADPNDLRFGRIKNLYGNAEHVCQLTCDHPQIDVMWRRCTTCGAPPSPKKAA